MDDISINPDGPIINKACTSQTQKWGRGKAVGNNPKALEECDYDKKLKNGKKLEMDRYLKTDPRPEHLRKTSQDSVNLFFKSLKKHENKKLEYPNGPMWLHTLNKNETSPDVEMNTPAPEEPVMFWPNEYLPEWVFQKVFDILCSKKDLLRYKTYDLSEQELKFYKSKVLVDMFKAYYICKQTINQSQSEVWFEERKPRITASKAHQILR